MTSSKAEVGAVNLAAPTSLEASTDKAKPPRDVWVGLGLGVAAVSAAFSSFDGLRSLAEAAHWSPYMAPLFAIGIDAYALAAIRVWLARSTAPQAAAFARKNAIGAVVLSLSGNAIWHLINAGLLAVTWPVVLGVGSVPPVILGMTTHLSILRKQDDSPVLRDGVAVPEMLSQGVVGAPSGPRVLAEDELLDAARIADNEFRARYGQGITRDLLRTTLGVGGQKATNLLRQLRGEDPPAVTTPKARSARAANRSPDS